MVGAGLLFDGFAVGAAGGEVDFEFGGLGFGGGGEGFAEVAAPGFPGGGGAEFEELGEELVEGGGEGLDLVEADFEEFAGVGGGVGVGVGVVWELGGGDGEAFGAEGEGELLAGGVEDEAGFAGDFAGAEGVAGFGHAGGSVAAEGVAAGLAEGAVEVEGAVDHEGGVGFVGEFEGAVAGFGFLPEPEEEFVAEELFGFGAFCDPGVFGGLAFAFGAEDEAGGFEVFVVAAFAEGFEVAEGGLAGGEGEELGGEGAFEELAEFFEGGSGGGGVDDGFGGVPEDGDELGAAVSAVAEFVVELAADGVFDVFLLGFGEEAGGGFGEGGFFFEGLVGAFEFGGGFVGVDAEGEEDEVGEDVVFEGESSVEEVSTAGPAVVDFLGYADVADLECVVAEEVEEFFGRTEGFTGDDGETAEGDGT